MADDRELAEATASLSFAEFLDRMKDPAAADLVRSIKNFIKTYEERKRPDPDADSHLVQQFLAKSEGAFRQHPVWATGPSEHQAQAIEGLEKYLMTKIYTKSFAVSAIDKERDEALSTRMAALNFIKPVHLDIPECFQDEKSWLLAMKELHKINSYKAPRDKLVCVLNCCRIINNLLHTSNSQGEARGADDFLPILIYIVIHANPPQLSSNLEYIQRFRMHSRMVSESSYFFTQLYSAASFIETINTNSLTMDSDEFVARMVAAGVPDMQLLPEMNHKPTAFKPLPRLDTFKAPRGGVAGKGVGSEAQSPAAREGSDVLPLNASSLAPRSMSSSDTPSKPSGGPSVPLPSLEEIERLGVQQVLNAEACGDLRKRNPYIYSSADDLRVADVELLLTAYKQLVLRYEALSLGFVQHRSAATSSQRPSLSFADAPPAISGPNPFAAGPNPFGEASQQKPFAPPAAKSPVKSPRTPHAFTGQGNGVGGGLRPLRVAESDPFPSLAASHRQGLSQNNLFNASSTETPLTPLTYPKLDPISSAALRVPARLPPPQPSLSPIASHSAPTSAAAAAIAAVTASRTTSATEQPAFRDYSNAFSEARLSTVLSEDARMPSELQAQLRQGWSNMSDHHEAVAASRSASVGSQPSYPPASIDTSHTEDVSQNEVTFPLCPIPTLFDADSDAGEPSLSHLSHPTADPFADAERPRSSVAAQPAMTGGVTFPADLSSPFTSPGPPTSIALTMKPAVSNALSLEPSVSDTFPTESVVTNPELKERSVGHVMAGFANSPFVDSANDSFAKSNSFGSIALPGSSVAPSQARSTASLI